MTSPTQITVSQLSRLVGLPDAPVLVDVCIDEDFADDPRLLPTAFRHPYQDIAALAPKLAGERVVVICQKGRKLSQGAAAVLRNCGIAAESLEGGVFGWRDVEDVFWSHRGDQCTFDTMIREFALETEPMKHLATIIRGADTNRHDLAPESAGLMAASLGLSRMYRDDLAQLDAGMALYDAFYRWVRDASNEGHDWPAATTGA